MLYAYLWLKTWFENEEGQDLIEYVLIAGLVSLVAVGAIGLAGKEVKAVWDAIQVELAKATP
jgi:Flp pilus assembly pilin Flp